MQVLQIPILKPKNAKKLLTGIGPKIPLLGQNNVPSCDDTLEQYLQHAGSVFGKDPSKWEQIGKQHSTAWDTLAACHSQPHVATK